jgi:pimeloyl-ACP methyl ester carboxylesterase
MLTNMKTQFFSRDRGFVAYDDTGGTGIPIFCLPGLGDLRQEYRYLHPILKLANYRVITMDLRGHGESSVNWSDYSPEAIGDDLLALMEHLNIKQAIVMGTSYTAASAVWAAGTSPSKVLGLVLLGPFIRDIPLSLMQSLMMRTLLTGPWRVAAWIAYYSSLYPSQKPVDFEEYRQKLTANFSEKGRFDALRAMVFGTKEVCERQVSNVKVPSLTIMGTKDPDFTEPEEEAKLIAQKLSGNYIMVEGVGHYPHAERAEIVGNEILKFLNQLVSHCPEVR